MLCREMVWQLGTCDDMHTFQLADPSMCELMAFAHLKQLYILGSTLHPAACCVMVYVHVDEHALLGEEQLCPIRVLKYIGQCTHRNHSPMLASGCELDIHRVEVVG